MSGAANKQAASEPLVTFIPAVSFTGYPNGARTRFLAGVESAPVPASYVEMLRNKGHVSGPEAAQTESEADDGKQGEAVQPEGGPAAGKEW